MHSFENIITPHGFSKSSPLVDAEEITIPKICIIQLSTSHILGSRIWLSQNFRNHVHDFSDDFSESATSPRFLEAPDDSGTPTNFHAGLYHGQSKVDDAGGAWDTKITDEISHWLTDLRIYPSKNASNKISPAIQSRTNEWHNIAMEWRSTKKSM